MSVPVAEIEKGARSETRFFDAATVRLRNTPDWLIGIMPADIELDLRGIDAIAYVLYPRETWVERIPIQIKSSWGGVNEHRKKHPEFAKANIIYMVMEEDRDDDDIRNILYAELDRRRKKNIRFEKFLSRLLMGRLRPRAERRRQNHYASEMKDVRFPLNAPTPAAAPIAVKADDADVEVARTARERVWRWLFPPRDDHDWKPWSWMVPSHW